MNALEWSFAAATLLLLIHAMRSCRLWGSCWTAPPEVFPKKTAASWDFNPRGLMDNRNGWENHQWFACFIFFSAQFFPGSEFGGWARTAHVNYACSSKPASINRPLYFWHIFLQISSSILTILVLFFGTLVKTTILFRCGTK